MAIPRILSIGKDATLMSTRKSLLLAAGYGVEEAFSVDTAISLAISDLIDVTILCHTVFQSERYLFISTVRQKRQLLPILCVRSYPYQSVPQTCIAVENEPEVLLNAIAQATNRPSA
jgi:PleD family two-component response regulator